MRYSPLLAVFTCCLLFGCSGKAKDLVGKWRDEAGTTTIEFSSDGKVTIAQGGATNSTWYKLQGNKLTMGSVSGLKESDTVTWKVSGDTLTLGRPGSTGPGPREQTFKRVTGG